MTSNERKIIKCLWEAKGEAHIRDIAQKTNCTSDYARLLCRSLARAGYIKLEDSNICHLLKKGQGRFSAFGEENNPTIVAEKSEPVIETVNVTLLTDDPSFIKAKDEELDKALADLNPMPKKDISEEIEKLEESSSAQTSDESLDGQEEMEDKFLTATEVKEEETKIADAEVELKPEPEEIKEKESSEKATPKEEPVKPSGGLGVSFKKIINWFAEKK